MNPTPSCPKGAYEFLFNVCDVDLVCHLDYVPAEKGSTGSLGDPYERDIDKSMELFAVYVSGNDSDLQPLLLPSLLKLIERDALTAYQDKAP